MRSRKAQSRRAIKVARREGRKIKRRLAQASSRQTSRPVLGSNIHYEVANRTRAISSGGIGLVHLVAEYLGLPRHLNELEILKRRLPYHDSDHILTVAYNLLAGGTCLEDVERLRNDGVFLDAVGADRIPDPTTLGDYTRRFDSDEKCVALQHALNRARLKAWAEQPASFFREATIDIDGTCCVTNGNCKAGTGIDYKGRLGYQPLVVSLAQTGESLFIVNRPGNANSAAGAAHWEDRAIDLVREAGFRRVTLRGDTAFSQSSELERWDADRIRFIFGLRVSDSLESRLQVRPECSWRRLERPAKYEVKTEPRGRRHDYRKEKIRERGYRNYHLNHEDITDFEYRPSRCKKTFRLVVVRKTIRVEENQQLLHPEIRYFAYLTNDTKAPSEQIVFEANHRCDQERLIEELKNQVNAMRMPVDNLHSNWAYMLMASLAHSLSIWCRLLLPEIGRWKKKHREEKNAALKMSFRRFVTRFVQTPVQIIRRARKTIHRLLATNEMTPLMFRLYDHVSPMRC